MAGVSVAATPLSYSAVAMRCEAFGSNARRNMSVWMNLDGTNQTLSLISVDQNQLVKVSAFAYMITHSTLEVSIWLCLICSASTPWILYRQIMHQTMRHIWVWISLKVPFL